MRRWMTLTTLAVATSVVGCDGMTNDGAAGDAPAVIRGAYSIEEYPPGKPDESYLMAAITFDSTDDIDRFAEDKGCYTDQPSELCPVVDVAHAAAGQKPFLEFCHKEGKPKIGYIKICCHPVLGWPPLSCSITWLPPTK